MAPTDQRAEGLANASGSPAPENMSNAELDALYWRAIYAERARVELQAEVTEERLACKKRLGHLERENDKLKRLLRDASTRLKSMRAALEGQEQEIEKAIKIGTTAEEDSEMQRYHMAMKRIEAGQLPPLKDGQNANSSDTKAGIVDIDGQSSIETPAQGEMKEDRGPDETQAVRVASRSVAAAPNQSQCCVIA